MRKIAVSAICFLAISFVSAQQVSLDEAQKIADVFFGKTHKSLQTCADIAIEGQDTLYYVFNADNGFVIIAGNKKSIPVLAFSDASSYDKNAVIAPVKMWLDYYQRQISELSKATDFLVEEKVIRAWEELQNPPKIHKNTTSPMAPLLTSKWGQGKNYNYYCPQDDSAKNNNYRAVTGCVATAMAQIMYYFRFPEQGVGSYTYQHDKYGTISADFSEATYDYSGMTDKPNTINWQTSLLMYHCGVSVDMLYGAQSSGMYNHKAAYSMKTYFGYSPETQYVFRDSTTLDWDSLIVSHLDRKIPLYYAGWSVPHTDGHAFVCDAYQIDSSSTNYYYHFNFGWNGHTDGYFYINPLLPDGNNFDLAQELIINAYPDTNLYAYPKPIQNDTTLLTAETGSFTHGSIFDCPSAMEHTWIIRPDVDIITSIAFDITYNLAEHDTLFITSANGQVNKIITNDASSYSTNTTSREIIVRLKTTNTVDTSNGFSANYATKYPTFCTVGGEMYNKKQDSFDDGSGTSRYNNFADCKKLIRVNDVETITLYFSQFETEKDKDILYVYDYYSKELLMELSGKMEDWDSTEFTFNTNAIEFLFATDEKNVFDGWALSYDTDVPYKPSSIAENINDFRIDVFPNPVQDNLSIQIDNILSNGQIQLFDMYGKLIQTNSFQQENATIDLSNIASGIYTLKISDGEKLIAVKKVVKQ